MTTTTQKLEKQKEELLNSLAQIMKDSSVPMSEKLLVIKELSRAIANITEQINKMTVGTPLVPVEVKEKIAEERKKEEIKETKKEKVEMQPKQYQRK
jgi:hypothetical protein